MFKTATSHKWCSGLAIIFFVLMLIIIMGSSVFASEGGGNHYTGGNEDFMSGAAPPPGFYYLNYLAYYTADKLRDNDRNKIPVDFKLDVIANAFRFLYSSKVNVFGANLLMHTIIPVVNMHVNVAGAGQTKTGLGDIVFGPGLAWHTKNVHCVAGLDFIAPTGSYDVNDLANIGRNYWTFDPFFIVTYISDGGWEASGKFMYYINTTNSDNQNYRSGQEFSMDYLLGKHFGPWAVGINGHYLIQTTDDTYDNEPANFNGNRGGVVSVGPAVQYNYKNMSFDLKYQVDTQVRNRPDGDLLWFKFIYAF